jgi:hypothetical protein
MATVPAPEESLRRSKPTSRELAFIIGVPAAWAILLLFHPLGGDSFYETIDGNVTAWITVHLGMGVFVPLFAGVVYLLLRGLQGTAATISRIGLAVFAIFYAAWELVLGVGTGILTHEVNALPQAQQAVGADLVDSYAENGVIIALSVVGSIGLAAPLVLMLLAVPLIAVHEPPFGPVGLAIFIAAVLLLVRQQVSAAAPSAPPVRAQPA